VNGRDSWHNEGTTKQLDLKNSFQINHKIFVSQVMVVGLHSEQWLPQPLALW